MRKLTIAVALLLFLTPSAWAGAYVGASLGQSDSTVVGGASSASGDDSSWKIMGGYTFMKFVAVEGSYRNLGGINDTIGTTSFDTKLSSLDVFGVGILPLGKVDVFAKLGFSRIDLSATIDDPLFPVPITLSTNENELAYGIGVSMGFGKAAVRLEYETFDTPDTLSMFSAGAVFKF